MGTSAVLRPLCCIGFRCNARQFNKSTNSQILCILLLNKIHQLHLDMTIFTVNWFSVEAFYMTLTYDCS